MNTWQEAEDQRWSQSTVSRAAIRGIAWMGAQFWGYNVIALGVFVVLGRLLSPTDFGLAASASVIILLLRVVVDAGFSQLLVQRSEITKEHIDTAFWTALGLGTVFTIVTAAAAPLFAELFGQPRLTNVIRVLSLIFILVGLDSTQSALANRDMRFQVQAIRRLSAAVVSAAGGIALAVAGFGVWALVGQQLLLEATTVILLWRLSPWRPSFHFSQRCWQELASFGARYSVLRVLWYLSQNADNFLIASFMGPLALGYYVIAYRVLVVLNELLSTTISSVSLSAFSKLKDDTESLNDALYKATASLAALGLPAYVGLAVVAHRLIVVVFGAKWAPSVPVLEALTLAGVMQSLSACISSYVIAIGRIRYEMWSVLVVVSAELIGFRIAVGISLVAVALALGIVQAIALPVRVLLLRRWNQVSVRRYVAQFPRVILAAAIEAGGVLLVGRLLEGLPNAATLVIQILTGTLLYVAALRLIAPELLRDLIGAALQLRGEKPASPGRLRSKSIVEASAQKPSFFIVGAPKCGTSSLHSYLSQHPRIFLPDRKDVPFFGSDLEHTIPGAPTSVSEYLELFAGAPADALIGDSCTLYMQSRLAAEEIAQACPEARIIIMLRNPVDLLPSLHSHNVWMTEEDLDFREALAAEPDRRAGRRIPSTANFPMGLWYMDVVALADQVERYLNAFPADRVHIILFDDLRTNSAAVVEATFAFLGLETPPGMSFDRVNERRRPRSKKFQVMLQQPPPQLERAFQVIAPRSLHGKLAPFLTRLNQGKNPNGVDPALRAELELRLRPEIEALEQRIGRDLSGWYPAHRVA